MKKLLGVIVLSLLWTGNANAADLTNTVWKTIDSRTGHIREIEFHENGRCAYKNVKSSYNQSEYYSIHKAVCNWSQSNKKISYNFRKYMFLEAIVNTTSLSGELTYPNGNDTFKGELIGYLDNGHVVRKKPKTKKEIVKKVNSKEPFFCLEKNVKDDEYYIIPYHNLSLLKSAKCDFTIYKSEHFSSYSFLQRKVERAFGAGRMGKVSGYDLYRYTKADNIFKRDNVTKKIIWNNSPKKQIAKKTPEAENIRTEQTSEYPFFKISKKDKTNDVMLKQNEEVEIDFCGDKSGTTDQWGSWKQVTPITKKQKCSNLEMGYYYRLGKLEGYKQYSLGKIEGYKQFSKYIKNLGSRTLNTDPSQINPIICYRKNGTTYSSYYDNRTKYNDLNEHCSSDSKILKYHEGNFYLNFSNQTLIAKKEPTVEPKKQIVKKTPKPEKKFELFKKSEKKPEKQVAKQKEFKLDEKDFDNDPPIITIAESITVNNADYEIIGEVKDKSKKIFVLVDGQPVDIKRGKFKIKRFSPIDEKVEIVAIDKWNNRSKKTVNVKVDIKSIDIAEQLEKLDPRKIKGKRNSNAVALIIGVEKYTNAPEANYANLDAKFFAEYAKKAFGVKSSNLKLLIDQDASFFKTLSTLSKWLPSRMIEGETDLIIFFAGHGLASSNGEKLYLLAQDSDTELLDRTALSREELFKAVLKFKPKSVTMFLDTCYSGVSRDEKTLLASARPIRISVKETNEVPDNFTIFSASQLDQISSSIKEAKHGIFSYYLMKGLEGKADLNKDRSLTNKELLTFMKSKVNAKAVELGRQQIPVLTGNPDKVILTY